MNSCDRAGFRKERCSVTVVTACSNLQSHATACVPTVIEGGLSKRGGRQPSDSM